MLQTTEHHSVDMTGEMDCRYCIMIIDHAAASGACSLRQGDCIALTAVCACNEVRNGATHHEYGISTLSGKLLGCS